MADADFLEQFSLEAAFDGWRSQLASPVLLDATGTFEEPASPRARLLDVLSDDPPCADSYLVTTFASYLRSFGQRVAQQSRARRAFWARARRRYGSVEFGLTEAFRDTPGAWDYYYRVGGVTPLGLVFLILIDAKGYDFRCNSLAASLHHHREREHLGRAPGVECKRYFGLVAIFGRVGIEALRGAAERTMLQAQTHELIVRRGFDLPSAPDDLGWRWPTAEAVDARYRVGFTQALFELPELAEGAPAPRP